MKIYKTHFLLKALLIGMLAGFAWKHTCAAESAFIKSSKAFSNEAEIKPSERDKINTSVPERKNEKPSVYIKIYPYPVTAITGPLSVCAGATAQYSTTDAMASYAWSVTGGAIKGSPNGRTVDVTWGSGGVGIINIHYTNAGNCDNTASLGITVHSLPLLPTLQIGGKTTIDWNSSTTLTVLTPVNGVIHWYDAFRTNLLHEGYVYTTPNLTANTSYYLRLQNQEGCESSDEQEVAITVRPPADAVIVAEAITPNNDGYNDTWIIRNIERYPNNRIVIYNRWGDKVYQTTGYSNSRPWGGYPNVTLRVGSGMVPRGTYFYQIELNDGSGRVYKGSLEVVY